MHTVKHPHRHTNTECTHSASGQYKWTRKNNTARQDWPIQGFKYWHVPPQFHLILPVVQDWVLFTCSYSTPLVWPSCFHSVHIVISLYKRRRKIPIGCLEGLHVLLITHVLPKRVFCWHWRGLSSPSRNFGPIYKHRIKYNSSCQQLSIGQLL